MNIIRISTDDYKRFTAHLAKAGQDESFIYCLFSKSQTPENSIYICNQLLIPDDNELTNRSPVSIEADQRYQAMTYNIAYNQKLSIMDIHTHPFTNNARFSGIDDKHGIENAKYIAKKFPEDIDMGMIVFGKGFDNFEARIWNKETNKFDCVNRIEILGSPTIILNNIKSSNKITAADPYARHRIIPGWKQGLLEDLKVFVCGLGGNGSLVFESLLALGVGGNDGWIKACDPDILEDSNLPRIPYTYPEEVGYSKAGIAQVHAENKSPELNVQCYENSLDDDGMYEIIKEANIIIGCVDNDGARLIMNELATKYMIPFIDLGTEIIPDEAKYESVGQIQIYLPCKTGCLVCSGAIDPSKAALDTMTEEENALYEHVGYVRGSNETPTPSILHLNGVISHLAISQFIKMIFDDGVKGKEYLHYNAKDATMFTASVERNDKCPVCGIHGFLASGDVKEKSIKHLFKGSNDFKSRIIKEKFI